MEKNEFLIKCIVGVSAFFSLGLAVAEPNGWEQTEDGIVQERSLVTFEPLTNKGLFPTPMRGGSEVNTSRNAVMGPAPALTRVSVYAIGSSNCNWEIMTSQYQSSTTCDHGGSQLRAAVLEIGYSGNRVAKMINGLLPTSANYFNEGICISGGQYTFPCGAGYEIVGWLRYYNLDGNQAGLFEYQSTSANPPIRTFYTKINIK